MKFTNRLLFACGVIYFFFFIFDTHAQAVPSGQDAGSTIQRLDQEKAKQDLSKSLEYGKKKAEIEGKENVEQARPAQAPTGATTKVLIKSIVVEGVTLLKQQDIQKVTTSYEGKELNLDGFREVADKITDLYRRKGYATSFAFVRPQKINNNTLVVSIVEGRVGDVRISGNKWFRSHLLMHYLELRRDQFFNYDVLRENLRQMNEHPDVNGRAVLSRSEAPGATDVEVQVKEHVPFHATLGYNNYNSTFLGRNKYSVELKSTNFSGHGDILSGEIQAGEAYRYHLYSGRYLFPLTSRAAVGVYYLHVNQALGRSLRDLHIKGEGDVANAYFSYKLIDRQNFSLDVSPSFEYKDIKNQQSGLVTSEDNTRAVSLGFDLDASDAFKGRTIVTQQFDFGIPNIMGGISAKDDTTSRLGGAGRFFRSVTNAARVQAMPFSSVLMFKGAAQLTNYNLTASEQFQVGGYYTVRGYPVSELSGDKGITLSAEWYFPLYFLPKDKFIPHTNTSWRDAFSVMGFFDWGVASNNSPKIGEIKKETIHSAGPGVRFNITNSYYVAFDYGFPLGQQTSDGTKGIAYVETKIFF
ncbi:MAG: ShlB/FhaC/HecB family hemolysin secretion/activation protein [Candidatus Omnitrophica bacterium]|nr:ShlB/FhaC/HecB family hemolysin secretion/activation protein [Candidatus Omnitrophota bacterium]